MPDTQKVGVELVADGSSQFKQALDDSNKALGDFGNAATQSSGQIDALGQIAIGALRAIGEAAVDFIGSAISEFVQLGEQSFDAALKSEQQQAQLGQSVDRANAAIAASNAKAAASQDIVTTSTVGSSKEIAKLTAEVEKHQQSLQIATARYDALKHPSEAQTLVYQQQQQALKDLQTQLSAAEVTTTNVAKANKTLTDSFSVDALNAMAKQYRDLVGGSEDAVVAIEQVGVKAGTVTQQQMPDFIKRVADLAAVTGDATSAATQLARAQDDPMGAFTRLEKQTGVYDVALKAQIASMVKAGDTAGATAKVMDFVAEATGGAAAANADTMAGKWDILKNHLEDAGKGIFEKLLPGLETLFDTYITPNIPVIENLADQFSTKLLPAFGNLQAGITSALPGIEGGVNSLLATLNPIIMGAEHVGKAFGDTMPQIQGTVNDMVKFVQGKFAELSPTLIQNVTTTLNTLAQLWQKWGPTIMVVVDMAFRFIFTIVSETMLLISGIITTIMQLINGDWEGAWTTIRDTAATFMQNAMDLVGGKLSDFTKIWQADWNLFLTIIQAIWQKIDSTVGAYIDKIKGYVSGFIGALAADLQSVKDMASEIGNIVSNALGVKTSTGGRAEGGFVAAGQTVMAGELGPELVTPMSDSWVFPAATTQQILNGGPNTTSNSTNWTYAPTYYSAPPQPSVDFAIMQVMAQ